MSGGVKADKAAPSRCFCKHMQKLPPAVLEWQECFATKCPKQRKPDRERPNGVFLPRVAVRKFETGVG